MSLTDPIGDMLTRIRNAQMRRRGTVVTPASTLRGRILDVLKSEGFIRGYSEQKTDNGLNEYEIELKYSDDAPVIRTIERLRPGRRVYVSVKNIPSVANGLGVSIWVDPGRDGRSRSKSRIWWRGASPGLQARPLTTRRKENVLHRQKAPGRQRCYRCDQVASSPPYPKVSVPLMISSAAD